MTDEPIKKTYRDVEIIYVERDDKWNFTVNGKERNRESLAKAKESIDRALDTEVKERPWKPFEAWYENRYGGSREYLKVRVTSEADRDYGRRYFWITREIEDKYHRKEQKRSKEQMDHLFAVSPENDERIDKIIRLREQAEKLYGEARTISEQLTPILATEAAESTAG